MVSRKVHKSAVVRNRIRRRIYEIVRMQESRIAGSYDLIYTIYSDQLAEMPHEQLNETIVEKLEKAGIFEVPTPKAQTKS